MSVLLRTISAFPSGRTTSELFALLDVDFDPRKRSELYAELSLLTDAGKIAKGRDGKWRPLSRYLVRKADALSASGPQLAGESKTLRAAPASFRTSAQQETLLNEDADTNNFDPAALLRYYRSTLRADPRGAISQLDDRHGIQWHLVTGQGPLTPENGQNLRIAIALNDLSDEFRKALVKREANEQTLAVGWPIAVGRKQGAPVVWPIGLISAEWSRSETHLEITVDADDILVNPDWLKGAARGAGWTEATLRDVFSQSEGLGLDRADFLARLKEAVAGAFRGKISGSSMVSEVDPETPGIYDLAALFLPTDSTFTAGAVRDLDQIGTWATEKLARTSLASILGLEPQAQAAIPPAINIGSLNKEQITAVQAAMTEPLTVITGPPGTGKSQTIVSMVASVLAHGGSVLVASKNHQALDAVEDRLAKIAPDSGGGWKRDKPSGAEVIQPVPWGPGENDRPSLAVETLSGYGKAKTWALDLKADLADHRAGALAWSEMSTKLLLHGPPGTGKTTFARALCNSLQIPLVVTSVSTWLQGGHLNDVIARMAKTFVEARALAPAILFIDEIDGIGKRQPAEREYADYWNTVVNKALELLDGAVKSEGVIIVGATNRPHEIDDALKRSGRLETHIEIPLPDIATLTEIFAHHLGDDLASLVNGKASDETKAGEVGSEASGMNADEAEAPNIQADRDSDEHTLRDAREGAAT